jgi:UDP-glucose 4-epimerase
MTLRDVTDRRGPYRPPGHVLVLGVGFIGAPVARALLDLGVRVSVLTRTRPVGLAAQRVAGAHLVVGDADEMGVLASALSGVDHVVWAVGSSSPAESDLDPAHDVAAVVPPFIRLLELLRLQPLIELTFLSSGGAVYGNVEGDVVVHEDVMPRPISSYGIIKLTCERYLDMYAEVHGVRGRVVRLSNAYGPGQSVDREQGLIARLLRCARHGEPLPVFGPSDPVRDYVYIDDAAAAVAGLVCRPDVPRVVNVGSGHGHPVSAVRAIVEEVSGRPIECRDVGVRAFDVRANVLDISRLTSLIDFRPRDLRAGVAETWRRSDPHPASILESRSRVSPPAAWRGRG